MPGTLIEHNVQIGARYTRPVVRSTAEYGALASTGDCGVVSWNIGKRKLTTPFPLACFRQLALPAADIWIKCDHIILGHLHQRLFLSQVGVMIEKSPKEKCSSI